MADVLRFYEPGDRIILVGGPLQDSAVVKNTALNYPILNRLVPRISIGAFWPLSYQLQDAFGMRDGSFVNTNTFVESGCPADPANMEWLAQSFTYTVFRSAPERLICVVERDHQYFRDLDE
jgi:hypothetical protein